MTDKEKLEKIVAYLGRRMYAHNQKADIGSTGEIFDEKIENAKYEECRDTLNFIDSMQEEPVSCLDNGDMPIERWKQAVKAASNQRNYRSSKGLTETRDDYFVDGVQWADEHPKEEPASDDLEQAIDTYLATYFGGEKEKQDWPFLKKMAIHFAKWKEQQMMANAVSAQCFGFQGAALFSFRLPADKYLVGSEVKVIVIKED